MFINLTTIFLLSALTARKKSHETKSKMPRKVLMKHKDLSDIQQSLEEKGLPAEGLVEHIRGRKRTRASNNNKEDDDDDDKMELGMLIYIDYVVDKYIYIYILNSLFTML